MEYSFILFLVFTHAKVQVQSNVKNEVWYLFIFPCFQFHEKRQHKKMPVYVLLKYKHLYMMVHIRGITYCGTSIKTYQPIKEMSQVLILQISRDISEVKRI